MLNSIYDIIWQLVCIYSLEACKLSPSSHMCNTYIHIDSAILKSDI